ncbi:MAG: arginine--tRNA ligase, partial [Pseudomonadota bacterium]|nr:arginine--tRNA ligase [Pseudomonadota bacterium]
MQIEQTIIATLHTELTALGLSLQPTEISLTYPPNPELGHYALPCFSYAQRLRLPAAELATILQQRCQAHYQAQDDTVAVRQVGTAGGFLNFYLNTEFLARQMLPLIANAKFFQPQQPAQTYMVEYSQPNTHKIFHVGHVRNVCLGDSICRLLRYCGHQVIAANYIGDEGTHVAKCLWHLERSGEQPPTNHRSEWLGKHYQQATVALAQQQPDQQAELSAVLRAIATKQGKFYKLWQQTRAYCLQDFAAVYRWLQTDFDVYYYESEVPADEIIKDYKRRLTLSEGAYGVELGKLGFFMLLKSDGNTLYATKDLALAQIKFKQYQLDHSLYVVGAEQKHYFQQVFKALEVLGISNTDKNYHISYGLVRLQSGKMSSRQGNIIPFSELQKQLTAELTPHLQKYRWNDEQLDTTRQKLASGAIKYGMLQTDPVKEIIFDLKAWLQFEGNTGLYLIYAYARANSLLTKAGITSPCFDNLQLLNSDAEEELLLLMLRFNSTVHQAATKYKPSILATLLYSQARAFSVFYTEHAILKASSDELRQARLALVYCFRAVMLKG